MRHPAILAALLLAGCHVTVPGVPGSGGWVGGGPAVVSMQCNDWDFRYGSGTGNHPACNPNGTFGFVWNGEVDYLTTNVSISAKDRAKATVKIENAGAFTATDGCSPAAFGIMLEVRNDDLRSEDGRWWARLQRPPLGNATYDFDAPITDLAQWSNVQGHVATDRPDQFRNAMANLGAVGLTFGACSFGHGVSGSGKLTVSAFSVQ